MAYGSGAEGHDPDVHLHSRVVGEPLLIVVLRLERPDHRHHVEHARNAVDN